MEEATVELQQNYCYSWFNSILHHLGSPVNALHRNNQSNLWQRPTFLWFCGKMASNSCFELIMSSSRNSLKKLKSSQAPSLYLWLRMLKVTFKASRFLSSLHGAAPLAGLHYRKKRNPSSHLSLSQNPCLLTICWPLSRSLHCTCKTNGSNLKTALPWQCCKEFSYKQ